MSLLGDGVAVRWKPRFENDQQLVKIDERGNRDLGHTDLEAGTDDGIELPGRKHGNDAGHQLDMHELARCAPLILNAPRPLPEQRMPTVLHDDILPDMGTKTFRSDSIWAFPRARTVSQDGC